MRAGLHNDVQRRMQFFSLLMYLLWLYALWYAMVVLHLTLCRSHLATFYRPNKLRSLPFPFWRGSQSKPSILYSVVPGISRAAAMPPGKPSPTTAKRSASGGASVQPPDPSGVGEAQDTPPPLIDIMSIPNLTHCLFPNMASQSIPTDFLLFVGEEYTHFFTYVE